MSERLPRDWILSDLLREFPEIQHEKPVVFRCREPTVGKGHFLKQVWGGPQFADVFVEVTPADTLCITLGHEWPVGLPSEKMAELDRALLSGILAAMAERGHLALWGCRIKSTAVLFDERTSPISIRVAAALAVHDMMGTAVWTPHPPNEPEAA